MTKLGKYELLEELGRGGYGTVYRARETVLDVERAVKVLHPALISDPEFIERFRQQVTVIDLVNAGRPNSPLASSIPTLCRSTNWENMRGLTSW